MLLIAVLSYAFSCLQTHTTTKIEICFTLNSCQQISDRQNTHFGLPPLTHLFFFITNNVCANKFYV